MKPVKNHVPRNCTCHPSEALNPCQKKYAFSECELAQLRADRDELRRVLRELLELYEAPEDEIGGLERLVLNKVRKLLGGEA